MKAIFSTMAIAIASLASFALAQDPACLVNGGFTATCAFPGLYFNKTSLGMYCLNDMYQVYGYNWTWIDLDTCLTNNDGQLTPMTNGSYSSSCTNCTVTFNSTVHIACDCENVAGQVNSTSIDLNSIVYNVDGTMGCCEQFGNKTWKGPQAST